MSAMMMSQMAAASGLSGIPLFEGFAEAELARAGLHASPRALAPGEDLFTEGEPQTKAWFLRSGWVRMRVHSLGGHEATAVILGAGELCGLPFQKNAVYCSTVTALTETVAIGVPEAAFEALLAADLRISARVAQCMAERLYEMAQLKAINGERATLRLQLTLAWLTRKIGPRLPATRALLADLTGLRAETCSRALSVLRRKGIVKVSPRLVHVLQPAKLDIAPVRR